jgi:hypothetical protein
MGTSDAEKKFRSKVVKILSPICASPIENIVGDGGDPDVYCVAGWLELKVATRPVKMNSRVAVDVRPAQRLWLKKWRLSGGRAWTLTLLGDTWMLHEGHWASECLGLVTETVLRTNAVGVWEGPPSSNDLIRALSLPLPRIH